MKRTLMATLFLSCLLLLPGLMMSTRGSVKGTIGADPAPYTVDGMPFEKEGFRYLQVSGSPADIGYQHGSMLSDLVERSLSGYAHATQSWYGIGWRAARVQGMSYWSYVPQEQRDEMDGIVKGASEGGAVNPLGTPVDRWDILTLNSIWDIWWRMSPPGDPWWWFPGGTVIGADESNVPHHCSAFVATGSMTLDGGFVIGQSLWMPYFLAPAHAVFMDIIPEKGNRILMEVTAGMIWSGTEFYLNSAGLVVGETTLGVGHYKWGGLPSFIRLRQAVQYADSIDSFVGIMVDRSNGAYCGDYLIADAETNEVAILELGSDIHVVARTMDGYLGSCNYPWDPDVAKEMGEPQGWEHGCYPRYVRWEQLMDRDRGNVTAFKAMEYLGDHYDTVEERDNPCSHTLCGHVENASGYPHGSIDAKATNRTMTLRMETLARYGHSCGRPFLVEDQKRDNPDYVFDDLIDILPGNISSFGAFDPLEVKVQNDKGNPVMGARVILTSRVDGGSFEVVSGADGKALMPLLPCSHYTAEGKSGSMYASMSYIHDGEGSIELVLKEQEGQGGLLSGGSGALVVILLLIIAISIAVVLVRAKRRKGQVHRK